MKKDAFLLLLEWWWCPDVDNLFSYFLLYSTSLLTVQYFLPMSIISVAYARIAFRLWGSKTPGAAQTDRDHNILLNKKKVSSFWSENKKKGKDKQQVSGFY